MVLTYLEVLILIFPSFGMCASGGLVCARGHARLYYYVNILQQQNVYRGLPMPAPSPLVLAYTGLENFV